MCRPGSYYIIQFDDNGSIIRPIYLDRMSICQKRNRRDDSSFMGVLSRVGNEWEYMIREIDRLRADNNRLRTDNSRIRNERDNYREKRDTGNKQYEHCYRAYKRLKTESEELAARVGVLETSTVTQQELSDALAAEERARHHAHELELVVHNLDEEAYELREEASELRRKFVEADEHLNNEFEPEHVEHVILDHIHMLELSKANQEAFTEPVKKMQYVKLVRTSEKNHFYKFVFIETQTGRLCEVENIVTHADATARKCVNRGINSKRKAVAVSESDAACFVQRLVKQGFTKADVQVKWNKSMNFRWTDAFGRKGDVRAKASRDFLSSPQFFDEPLCPEILARVQELRGPLISGNDFPSTCLYCGGPASEDDHYMSRVRNGRINKYLDCAINLVPSCRCHRAGKDTKNSPASPLEWWLDKTHVIRRKNKHHPQNKLAEYPERRAAIEKNLRAFHAFFEEFAPALDEEYYAKSKEDIEVVLQETWTTLADELVKFDIKDYNRFNGSTLIKDTNQRFKASLTR